MIGLRSQRAEARLVRVQSRRREADRIVHVEGIGLDGELHLLANRELTAQAYVNGRVCFEEQDLLDGIPLGVELIVCGKPAVEYETATVREQAAALVSS